MVQNKHLTNKVKLALPMYIHDPRIKTILLAIGSSEIGGGQKVFINMIKELLKRNYDLIVALPEGQLYEDLKSHNVKLYVINFNSLKSLFLIYKLLKNEKIDIINTYLTKCSLYFSVVNLIYNKLICCTLLNAILHEKLNRMQILFYPLFYSFLCKICDGIIVNSKQNKIHFVNVAGIKEEFIEVIYSGIDTEEFSEINDRLSKNKIFSIGTIGRLSIEKGQSYLIDALALLKDLDFECVIVGDGPLRTELEDKVLKNNLKDKVKFLGFQNKPGSLINVMDVVVVPSLNETFGLAIVEAFALKKIVIASDVGGIPELVINKKTGFLFPVRDSSILAEKILYVYNNKEEAQTIAMNAYAYFEKNFTCSIMAEKTIQYYDYIVMEHSR